MRRDLGPPVAISKYPFSPATYPGSRPHYSFFFTPTGIFPCSLRILERLLADRGLVPVGRRFAILAYGSNACPGQLLLKYKNHGLRDVPVLFGRIIGGQAVYACRTTREGKYVPATLARAAGGRASWITLLTAEQIEAMNHSEGRPHAYQLAEVLNVEFTTDRSRVSPLYSYIDVLGGVMTLNGKPMSVHATSQKRARSLMARASAADATQWLDYETIAYPNPPKRYSQII